MINYLVGLGDIFKTLFNIVLEWGAIFDNIWTWLSSPLKFGFDIPLIGFVGLDFVPLNLLGVGILTLIGFWVIKSLVPVL